MSLESAAQLALDTLNDGAEILPNGRLHNALRAALAKAADAADAADAEPVAWQERTYSEEDKAWSNWYHIDNASLLIRRRYPRSWVELRPLYLHPPRRESAELSDAPAWKDAQAQIREGLAVLRAAGGNDGDRRDAERYRWLRDGNNDLEGLLPFVSGVDLDAAIDDAMRAAGGKEC